MIRTIPNKKKGEKMIMVLRRHPIVLFFRLIVWIVAAAAPLLLSTILSAADFHPTEGHALYAITVLFMSVYYLYIWLFAFHSFVDYYLDVWVVTSERVINIEQKALFARTVSELQLSRIQDVTHDTKGFFATFLHFGEVYIQTAGEEPRFAFKQVPSPDKVARKVLQLAEERRRFKRMMEKDDGKIHTH